jgi:type I restriction enzyme S subunit
MEWKEILFDDLCRLNRGFDLPNNRIIEGGVPVVASSSIKTFHNVSKVKGPGVVTGRSGTLGIVQYIEQDFWPLNTSLYVKDFKGNSPKFCFYFLQMMHLENFNAGAGVPTLNQNHLHKLKIKVPSTYEEQERVASILSNYDTLISINTKRIKLLEDSARELYKEWFVRLRFPGYEKTKFVKGVPEGWKPKTIDEICDSVGGGTPSTSNANYWGGIIKWVTPTDIASKQSLPLINIEGRITEAGLKHSSAKLLPTGTILMTSRASIGFFGICKEQVCTNQGFISIIPNEENLRMYILCNLMMRKEEIVSKANGATFLEISKGRFRKMEMLIPNNDVLSAFEERCSTIFDAVYNLEIQNQELAVTRDRLLPRLLSGELKVKA